MTMTGPVPTAPAAAVPPRRLRLPLIAALALAFVLLAVVSGAAYIIVLRSEEHTSELQSH